MSVLRQLYQLQLLDNEWHRINERLAEVGERLGESGDVERAREAIEDSKLKLGSLRAALRALELEVGGLGSKLKKNQERLYSGRVRNPKELSNLQDEAASLQRRQSELEDDQLELMIEIEEEEAELAERQARLRQIEATWEREQTTLKAENAKLGLHKADLEQERAAVTARIGAADLAMYKDLRQRTGGSPIALLRGGTCQTCGVDVPTGVAQEVERGTGLHDCPTCGRLLLHLGG